MTKNTWWLPDVRQDRIILSVLKHSQVYRPNLRPKSDADILRDAKLEAMGLPPQDESPRRTNHDRHQTATDEIVRSFLTCVILKNRLFLSSFRSWNASRNGCGSENHLSSEIWTHQHTSGHRDLGRLTWFSNHLSTLCQAVIDNL